MGRKRDRGSGLAHAALAAALGVALIAGVGGRPGPARAGEPPNPLLDWLNAAAAANGAHVEVSGEVVSVTDPTPDDPPVTAAVANLQQLQAYSLPMVPSWLSDCDASWTICSMRGRDEAWDPAKPGVLFLGEIGAPISAFGSMEGHLGVFLTLDGFPVQQTPDVAWTGASHLIMGRFMGTKRGALEFGVAGASFEPYSTRIRVFAQNDQPYYGILAQTGTDFPTMPTGFSGYGFVSGAEPVYDVLGPLGGAPTPIGTLPTLTFVEGVPATAPATQAATQPPVATAAATGTPPTTAPTPGPSGSGTPTSGGGLDPILLLVIFLLALILFVAGWWLWRGGRRSAPGFTDPGPTRPAQPGPPATPPPGPGPGGPGPPVGPGGPVVGDPGKPSPIPPPPPPPPTSCVEGDEEWRNDKPVTTFLIAPADARVRLTTDPTTPELEAWMAGFGFPHGATAAGFGAVDDAALDALLAGLPASPTEFHWVFEFQLDEYLLECERRWICEHDVWLRTNATRLQESGPTPYAGRFAVDGPNRTRDDVRIEWLKVRAALVGASAAEAAMDAYRKAC